MCPCSPYPKGRRSLRSLRAYMKKFSEEAYKALHRVPTRTGSKAALKFPRFQPALAPWQALAMPFVSSCCWMLHESSLLSLSDCRAGKHFKYKIRAPVSDADGDCPADGTMMRSCLFLHGLADCFDGRGVSAGAFLIKSGFKRRALEPLEVSALCCWMVSPRAQGWSGVRLRCYGEGSV